MTSQKRFRHQENKNNSRFRDLPPRFKRQKSVSSSAAVPSTSTPPPTPPGPSTETKVTVITRPPAMTNSDLIPVAKSPTAVSPSGYSVSVNPTVQLRARIDEFQTPPAVATASSWQWPDHPDAFVLSQWNSTQFNRASNAQPPHVALGTGFGYKPESPPLSPWVSRNAPDFTGQFGLAGNPTWVSPSELCSSQAIHSPSAYLNNENWAPNQSLIYPHSPGGSWRKSSTPQRVYNSPSLLLQDLAPLSARCREYNSIERNSVQPQVNYSDPDYRTIEMLRELERVADEKDNEDFGADRKSLVSHHLRMLMCAVDKYTEGIENEVSRLDEVPPAFNSVESASPSLPRTFIEKKADKINSKSNTSDPRNLTWCPGFQPGGNHSEGKRFSTTSLPQIPTANHRKPTLQPASAIRETLGNSAGPTVDWNLWSTPYFDLAEVLNQNLDDLTRNPFSRYKENDEEKRKPLYQR